MTDSLLKDEDQMSVREKYTFFRDILTRQFYEDAQEILEDEIEKDHENLEKTKDSAKESPVEKRLESAVIRMLHQQKEAPLTLSQENPLGDESTMDISRPLLMRAIGLTSVAYCAPLRKMVPAENVPRYHRGDQKENKDPHLTFQCPECHIPLVFFVAEKGLHPRFYFKYTLSDPESARQRHLLCLQQGFEKHWIDQIPEDTLTEILAFHTFERNLAESTRYFSLLTNTMGYLSHSVQAFKTLMPDLDYRVDQEELGANKILADFAMMAALQKKHQNLFHKEGSKILKGLGHLEETYLRFRQKTRQY